MHSPFRRWLILAMLALVPAQSVLAAGGMLCAAMPRADGAPVSDAPSPASAHAHTAHGDGRAMHHAADGNDDSQQNQRVSCSACAPCTGSLALPSVASLGAAEVESGDDFLPVVVDLRPARSDGLERPPRTI